MLLKLSELERIREGSIDTAFRRWKRPTVRAGGTLLTAVGQLAIDSIEPVSPDNISDADASRCGLADLKALKKTLGAGGDGTLYRIRLRYLGADPRAALREAVDDLDAVEKRLARLDAQCGWTAAVLAEISDHPAQAARFLAERLGMSKEDFKVRVRKLKALGLTESLEVGYRLSRRGAELLRRRATASA